MGDQGPERKPEEHYPLLKVDGGGDIGPQVTQIATPGLGVVYPRRKRWFSRWPEFMSACWMTMILFGISFLVFYALGMSTYRRQRFIFVKCNTSKPASNVFYHHIVPRGSPVPFHWHIQYFAYMATTYPSLYFNIFFLIDDSYSTRGLRQNRLGNKPLAYYPYGETSHKADGSYQAMLCFQKRFQNVNVTVIPLSKYMAASPLRYKWRTIPTAYLPFYARVFSVWEKGGIGMDLRTFRNAYEDNLTDRRICAILRQHNDGINAVDYKNDLSKIDDEYKSAAATFNMVLEFFNSFLNETRAFINNTVMKNVTISPVSAESNSSDILTRIHRAKREVPDAPTKNMTITEITSEKILNSSVKQLDSQNNESDPLLGHHDVHSSELSKSNVWAVAPKDTKPMDEADESNVVLVYDFQIVSDNLGPSYLMSEPLMMFGPMSGSEPKASKISNTKRKELEPKGPKILNAILLLSMDAEGTFVAASSKLHPFLEHLLSTAYLSVAPKNAIQDSFISQCSGLLKNDVYCNNINILYV